MTGDIGRTEGDDMDLLHVRIRLNKCRDMEDGWFDGGGVAPSDEGLTWLLDAFERLYPKRAPLPFTFPTPDGGIWFEWSINRYEISLEVNLSERGGVWHVLDMSTLRDEEQYLDLDDSAKWRWIGDELERMWKFRAVSAV